MSIDNKGDVNMGKLIFACLIILALASSCTEENSITPFVDDTNIPIGTWRVLKGGDEFNSYDYISITRYIVFSHNKTVTFLGEDNSRYRKIYSVRVAVDSLMTFFDPNNANYIRKLYYVYNNDTLKLRWSRMVANYPILLVKDGNNTTREEWVPTLLKAAAFSIDTLHGCNCDAISMAAFDYGIWIETNSQVSLFSYTGNLVKQLTIDDYSGFGIANINGELWHSGFFGMIHKIDTSTGNFIDSLRIKGGVAGNLLWGFDYSGYHFYAGYNDKIEVLDNHGNFIRTILFDNGLYDRCIVTAFPQYFNGYLWVAYLSHLYMIDPITGNAVYSFYTDVNVTNDVCLRKSNGDIWVSDSKKMYKLQMPNLITKR
jgi:hypothetical protein